MNFTFWLYSKNVTFWLLKISECFFFKGWEVSWTMTFFPRHIEYGKILVVWFWHIPVLLAADSDMVKVWNTLLIFLHKHCYKAFIYSGWHFTPQKSNKYIPHCCTRYGGRSGWNTPPLLVFILPDKTLGLLYNVRSFLFVGYYVVWCHMMSHDAIKFAILDPLSWIWLHVFYQEVRKYGKLMEIHPKC